MRGLVVVCLALAACRGKGDEAATCGTVASRFFTLTRDALGSATVDPATRREVSDQLPAMRDALGQLCSEGKWSVQIRNCLVQATDHAAFEACEQQLTDAQRNALQAAADGKTASP